MDQAVTIHAGHADIADQYVERGMPAQVQQLQRLGGGAGRYHRRALFLQQTPDVTQHVDLVFHRQHPHALQGMGHKHLFADAPALYPPARVAQRLLRLELRQPHAERGALPGPGTDGRDGAAMQLGQLLDDGKAEPQAAMATGGGAVGLAEAAEQVLQKFRCDAVTVVLDLYNQVAAFMQQADFDPPFHRSELDCIGQQIAQDLLQAGGITQHRLRQLRQQHLQRLRLAFDNQLLRAHCFAHLLGQIHHFHFQLHLAQQHAAQIEHVRHQVFLGHRTAGDYFHAAPHRVIGLHALQQKLAPAQHRGQRRTQLVRQRGEEFILHPRHALGGVAGHAFGGEQVLTGHFNLAPLGDIRAVAGQADEAPIGGKPWHRIHFQPTPLPVVTAHAGAGVQFGAPAQGCLQLESERCLFVRMHQPPPRIRAEVLIGMQPEERKKRGIDETQLANVIHHPHWHRQAIGQGAEARLALGQLGFNTLACRDVKKKHRHPVLVRLTDAHRLHRIPACRLGHLALELADAAIAEHPAEGREPVRAHRRHHITGAAADDIALAGDLLETGIDLAVDEIHRDTFFQHQLDHAQAAAHRIEHLPIKAGVFQILVVQGHH